MTPCLRCGHDFEFHINLDGTPKLCDHEKNEDTPENEQPELCGCIGYLGS